MQLLISYSVGYILTPLIHVGVCFFARALILLYLQYEGQMSPHVQQNFRNTHSEAPVLASKMVLWLKYFLESGLQLRKDSSLGVAIFGLVRASVAP